MIDLHPGGTPLVAMGLDARHWNLILPLALVAAACSSRMPVDGEEAGDTSGEESNTNGEDGLTAGNECDGPGECPEGYACSFGYCEPKTLCLGDDDCDFGLSCGDDGFCAEPEALPECDPLPSNSIPVGSLGAGVLHFAQVDGDPEDDLLLVQRDVILRIDAADAIVEFERAGGAGDPVSVQSVDSDLDGIEELVVMEENLMGALVTVGGTESALPFGLDDAQAGNFLGDGRPELAARNTSGDSNVRIFAFGESEPEEVWTIPSLGPPVILPFGPMDDAGFQALRYVDYAGPEPLLTTVAGQEQPSDESVTRLIGTQAPEMSWVGHGPLAGGMDTPVLLESGGNSGRLLAPTLGEPDELPPAITAVGSFWGEPRVIEHGETASVLVFSDGDVVRFEFDGTSFTCRSVLWPQAGAQRMVTGDIDADGVDEVIVQAGSDVTIVTLEP